MDGQAGLHVAVAAHRARWGLALAGLAACTSSTTVVTPIIDLPAGDPDATATGFDSITLSVAHAHSDADLASRRFSAGAQLELPGVPFADDLVVHMQAAVGMSTVAYGRSCQFPVAAGAQTLSPHLFFSRSVKFASVDVAPAPRIGGLGISYLGSALLVGGTTGASGSPVTDVEHFEPLTGQLTVIGTVDARDRSVEALLGTAPPRAVVVGGTDAAGGAKFVEVVDTQRVERVETTDMARIDLTATALTDGRVIVFGGNAPGQPPSQEIDEISVDGPTVNIRKLPAMLATGRSGHTATRLGEDVGAPVLIVGGVAAGGAPVATAELFKPLSEELADPKKFAPPMSIPRHGHTATLMPDGSVLIIGGFDAGGAPVPTLELFSVDGGFTRVGMLPANAGLVEFAATTLPDGRILLTGGRTRPDGPPLDTAYIARLDPLGGSVDIVATDHLAVARAGHQALLLCDGTVLVSGGSADPVPAERYNPPPGGRR
jgi:hypothetical protein